MANLIIVYWRDIPAQVIAKQRRNSAKVELTQRFAEAIDHAAMRAGKGSTDAYLEEWRRVSEPCGDDLQAVADEAAAKLEQDYDKERLLALIKNEGNEPS
ncbi:MAG: virulence factor [Arenicellales bacterium]